MPVRFLFVLVLASLVGCDGFGCGSSASRGAPSRAHPSSTAPAREGARAATEGEGTAEEPEPVQPLGPEPMVVGEGAIAVLGVVPNHDGLYAVVQEPSYEENEYGEHLSMWALRRIGERTLEEPIASNVVDGEVPLFARPAYRPGGARIVFGPSPYGLFELMEIGRPLRTAWMQVPPQHFVWEVVAAAEGAALRGLGILHRSVFPEEGSARPEERGQGAGEDEAPGNVAVRRRPVAEEIVVVPVGPSEARPVTLGRIENAAWHPIGHAGAVGARGAAVAMVRAAAGDERRLEVDVLVLDERGRERHRLTRALPAGHPQAGPTVAVADDGRVLVAAGVSGAAPAGDVLHVIVLDADGNVVLETDVDLAPDASARDIASVACGAGIRIYDVFRSRDRRSVRADAHDLAADGVSTTHLYAGADAAPGQVEGWMRQVFTACHEGRPVAAFAEPLSAEENGALGLVVLQ